MDYQKFVQDQIAQIRNTVGSGMAINALSGGVDSSVVTVLGHRALGDRLKTVFIDNALMREGEPQRVVDTFADMCIPVERVDCRAEFLDALSGLTDPEEKRQAITDTFYRKVFGDLVRRSGARFLLHGTILTDIEETVAGIKRQHNILAQLGIDPEKEYGYQVLEPLKELRKDGVREVAKVLGLPPEGRPADSVPRAGAGHADRRRGDRGPAGDRACRHRDRRGGAGRHAASSSTWRCCLSDKATGIRDGKREFGEIIVVRCVDSVDARRGHRGRASLGETPPDLRADHGDPAA